MIIKDLKYQLEELVEDESYYEDELLTLTRELAYLDKSSCDYANKVVEYAKLHADIAWTREKIVGVERQIEDELEYSDEEICGFCSGSGEGSYDGTSCHYCKGSGVASSVAYTDDDDYDELTRNWD